MPVTGQYRTTVGVLMAKEERHSAADLLNLAKGSNIKVAVYAILERILFDGLRDVIGVLFRDNVGRLNLAMLREDGEVILSAGAIGIPVVTHLPYVGQFLYDNPRNGISFLSPMLLQQSLIQVVGITDSGAYLEASSNVLPYSSPVDTVFMRPQSSPLYYSIVSIMEKIIGPLSAGSMRLASPEIITNPMVWFNNFSNAVDLQRCENGTRKIGELLRTRAMADYRFWGWSGPEFRFVGISLIPSDCIGIMLAENLAALAVQLWALSMVWKETYDLVNCKFATLSGI
ncbi:Glucose-methanol-choline oxidoreductase, C-terminal [Artemisia annua]|uniref:Glucose-methanol-choline oxidoreductase, C-terminal n=1 Tax=Artemisia annua TaxID=35608 RepID=A0A2U1NK46_ARTAN|nr:Glucose-methanol-choline oxidoreductase, C-terminal [Artemisia annua]